MSWESHLLYKTTKWHTMDRGNLDLSKIRQLVDSYTPNLFDPKLLDTANV